MLPYLFQSDIHTNNHTKMEAIYYTLHTQQSVHEDKQTAFRLNLFYFTFFFHLFQNKNE